MLYVDAGGARVPAIGLGTWQMNGQECQDTVTRALQMGYRHIDTAQAYDNEAKVGAGILGSGVPRDEIFVTTKIAPDNLRRDDVLHSARESRKRLGLQHVDLMLIHWPSEDVPLRETLGAMRELQDEGLTRFIGVSNFTPELLEEAMTLAPLQCIQVEHHPFLAQDRLLAMARQNDLMFTAYTPLAKGKVADSRELRRIGERHGKSATQVALRWLVQQHNVAAIPKSSSEDHLRENIDIFDFELSHDEELAIRELDRGERIIDPDFAPWG